MSVKKKRKGDKLNDIISQNIRGIIYGAGDSVQGFAEAFKTSRNAVWRRLSGQTPWTTDELQFVCNRYNVAIERLVNGYTKQGGERDEHYY